MSVSDETLARIADEVFDTMAAPREVPPFSERFPGFGLEDSYRIVNEIRRRREARGERVSVERLASPIPPHGPATAFRGPIGIISMTQRLST